MKIVNAFVGVAFLNASSFLIACPNGQHEQCVVPRPWPAHGCAQSVCVGNIIPEVPTDPIAVLNGAKDAIIKNLGNAIAHDPKVLSAAASGGWTIYSCALTGGSLFYSLELGYSTPICAAMSAAAETCVAFILASGGLVTGATCATLCANHRLVGRECNPQ